MPIGPSLPPHLAKRSREDESDGSSSPDSSEKRRRVLGPAPPPSKPAPPRAIGASLPPQAPSRASSPDSDIGPAPLPLSKPARVVGPPAPPAPLDERPPNSPSDDSDSSDDDFGPAPPPAGATYDNHDEAKDAVARSAFDTEPRYAEEAKRVERDAWMTMPPTQDDLGRMDPTKMRARKFNTGKSAGGASGGGTGIWTETPEQKLKRLQDEAMGISAPANSSAAKQESKRSKEEERKARKMREKIDASRGKSLVEQHQDKDGKEKDDDPSKRVFNYEKDMALGTKVSHKQKREMLNKAKGFGDRFSSGSYL